MDEICPLVFAVESLFISCTAIDKLERLSYIYRVKMLVVHLVGEIPGRIIQAAKAIKGQSACLKPVLATVSLDVPGNTTIGGINVHKTGNYLSYGFKPEP